jgi:cytochrome P450
MDAFARPIIPPAPKIHTRDLSTPRMIYEFTRSTIGIWPKHAFEDMVTGGRGAILVNDPEGIRHVLSTNITNYRKPLNFNRVIRPFTGAGVLMAEGADWRRQRRMLAPAFTPASVAALLPHFIAAAEVMSAKLRHKARANLSAVFHAAALDAVLRALYSTPASDDRASLAEMTRRYGQGAGRPSIFDGFANREEDFAFATRGRSRFNIKRTAAIQALISDRREKGNGGIPDLLDLLLAARDPATGETLSDTEVVDQSSTLLFAGFETTSRLLFWSVYLLTLDQVEQARLRREVRAFPPSQVQSLDDLANWPRLNQVLLEALRLFPPVPNMVREAIDADAVAGFPIEAKTKVWISPWVVHRHRKFWDQPTAFIPDRFAGKPAPWTSMPAFVPFSAGPRTCIGASFAIAEAKIVLATLLFGFEVSLSNERPVIPRASISTVPDHEPMFELRVTS